MKNNAIAEVEITYKRTKTVSVKVSRSQDAERYLRSIWSNQIEYREEMYLLLLNRANEVLGYNCLSKGGTAGTVVDVKMVLQLAIKTNAHAVILAHNHPSGNLRPSIQDKRLTEKVKQASELLEVQLLDHLILTGESFYSFADELEL